MNRLVMVLHVDVCYEIIRWRVRRLYSSLLVFKLVMAKLLALLSAEA